MTTVILCFPPLSLGMPFSNGSSAGQEGSLCFVRRLHVVLGWLTTHRSNGIFPSCTCILTLPRTLCPVI